jgi:hypothetical protein
MANKYFQGGELRRLFVGVILIACVILGLIAAQVFSTSNAEPRGPTIGLMTSLPLRWQESVRGKTFDLEAEPSAAFQRLQVKQGVRLLDNLANISGLKILVLAQPRALSPSEHVALDKWVRDGGRALILADPALTWESSYPMGDRRRPLFTSLLSPIFNHWGLQLELNMEAEGRDIVSGINGLKIRTQTIGIWSRTKTQAGQPECKITDGNVRADCRIGNGRAIMLADADLLLHENWQGTGLRRLFMQDNFDNMALLQQLIDMLQPPDKARDS